MEVISCGMYAFTEPLRQAWKALMGTLPDALGGHTLSCQVVFDHSDTTLLSPNLILGHICGYPWLKQWKSTHNLVAIPVFDLPGCHGTQYSSWFICHVDNNNKDLTEFAQSTVALNHADSNSGMNVLRFALKDLAHHGSFFRQVLMSGSHLESMHMVARGEADLASIDAVSWHHAINTDPALAETVRIFGHSVSTTGLPFIQPKRASIPTADLIPALNEALSSLPDDARKILQVTEFRPVEDSAYIPMLRMEEEAIAAGYPILK